MINRFIIGSGFFRKPGEDWPLWFLYNCWLPQIRRVSKVSWLHIIAVNDSATIGLPGVVSLDGNCGHVHALLKKEEPFKNHALCGWSATLCALAMIAYCNESDLIFVEQDALCFGPWIDRLYAECEGKQMVFGRSKRMPCAQSLILIKHAFIPTFVAEYLNGADERNLYHLPELRFISLLSDFPNEIGQFNFGCDRERPLPMDDDVWYFQKATPEELLMLRERKLLSFIGNIPHAPEVFSSTK